MRIELIPTVWKTVALPIREARKNMWSPTEESNPSLPGTGRSSYH